MDKCTRKANRVLKPLQKKEERNAFYPSEKSHSIQKTKHGHKQRWANCKKSGGFGGLFIRRNGLLQKPYCNPSLTFHNA